MIQVDKNAQEQMAAFFEANNSKARSVRVYLHEGGWSGPALALALDEPKDSDHVSEYDSVKYIVDDELMIKVGDITINFIQQGMRSGFSMTCVNSIADPYFSGEACTY